MRPEARLILHACGWRGDDPALTGQGAFDWDWLLNAAARHTVVPAVYRHLADGASSNAARDVPPHILDFLRARSDENALRNVMLTQRLVELLDCLHAAAIPVIPLKGPVLALMAYGDVALRQFFDLDLLIARADVPRARHVLADAGYRPLTPLEEGGGADAAYVAADYHQALVNDGDGVVLELHWGLSRHDTGSRADDAWAWRHAQRVPLLGRQVPALSWEAQLVYLCMHGSKHAWAQLGWVRDVAAITRAAPAPALDWRGAAQTARELGAARMLALGVLLAKEFAGGVAPDATMLSSPSEARVVRELAASVRARLFREDPPGMAELMRFQWRARDRLRNRVGYGVELFTSPRMADVSLVSLPVGLRALYHVLRPARLAAKYAARTVSQR